MSSTAVDRLRARVRDRRTSRRRSRLIERIGELEYIQRTDSAASYDNEIAGLVEEVRHLDRMEELRRRQDSSPGEH